MSDAVRIEVHIKISPGAKVKESDLAVIVKDWSDGVEPPKGVRIELVEWNNLTSKRHGIAKTKGDRAKLARLLHASQFSTRKVRKN
jgi:hypothetical protein